MKLPIFCCKGLSKSQHGELIDNSRVEKSHIVRSTADLAEIKHSFTRKSLESLGLHVRTINSNNDDDSSLIRTGSSPASALTLCIKIVVFRVTLPGPGRTEFVTMILFEKQHYHIIILISIIIIFFRIDPTLVLVN